MTAIARSMEKALDGRGQIVGITGEPGIGKSRLAYEAVRSSAAQPFDMFSGECESYGANTNYLVWRDVWLELFGLDRTAGLDSNLYNLERQFLQIDPLLAPRIPLLGAVLNLPFPDNDLTGSFDARLRKTSLETLLVDFLRAKSRTRPVLLLLEDCQWLDDLSHDLLGVIGRAIYNLPVFILMTYRPPLMGRIEKLNVEPLEYFTRISLEDFSPQEAALVHEITTRTGGNPFYIEELLNYLRDHNVDLRDEQVVENLELPDSLYSLILSRIDRISESQKVTLKVASVIGRVFRLAWLSGYYPQVGSAEQITANLAYLALADLTLPVPEEAEQTYLFKHIISREVAYESLPYNTRTRMHGLFARFVEDHYQGEQERFIDLLAFHYDNSDLPNKRREYLFKAGTFAQAQYANGAAVDYFRRTLPLVNEEEAIDVHLCLGQVLEIMGKWSDTLANYQKALEIATRLGNHSKEGRAEAFIGDMLRRQGHYADALDWLSKARAVFERLGDQAGIGQVLHYSGTIAASQGNYDLAKELYEKSLDIRIENGDRKQIANLYSNLGVVAHFKGENEQSLEYHHKALEIRRDIGDQWMIGNSLTNLGNVMMDLGKLAEARALQEDALANRRQSGDPWAIANVLNNLGNTVREMRDFKEALALYRESLQINYQLDDRRAVAYLLEDMGGLAAQSGKCEKAARLMGAACALRKTIGSPLSAVEQKKLDGLIDPARCFLGEGYPMIFEEGLGLPLGDAVAYALATDMN
jgi:predicted ATPase